MKDAAKRLLNRAIDYGQEKFPPNRVVVLLTPLVFAPAAGYVTALVAKQIPGVSLDSGQLTALFIAGGTAAVVKAYKWLDGWQKEEDR
jgi:hypothetical protein